MPPRKYKAARICALPVELINRTLQTDLAPGDAWLSTAAHQHFAEDHADDYVTCFPLLVQVIENPTWLGQAPEHSKNFELVTRIVNASRIVLVALCLEPNKYGNYNIASVYCIGQMDVEARRHARRLIPVVKSRLIDQTTTEIEIVRIEAIAVVIGGEGGVPAGTPSPDLLTAIPETDGSSS
jgi:hypothetical protein